MKNCLFYPINYRLLTLSSSLIFFETRANAAVESTETFVAVSMAFMFFIMLAGLVGGSIGFFARKKQSTRQKMVCSFILYVLVTIAYA